MITAYYAMTPEALIKLSDATVRIYKGCSEAMIGYHCLLESARHYASAEREYWSKNRQGINQFSMQLLRDELRKLSFQYKRAYLDYLYTRERELRDYLAGLTAMLNAYDYSTVAGESVLIKNTYDIVFRLAYEHFVKDYSNQIVTVQSDIASMTQFEMSLPWQD